MALLRVDRLTVTLDTDRGPVRAVRALSFDLARGETFGIVGESGCGKTMTALAIMGLLPPAARAEGEVRLDGADLLRLDEPALCRVRGNRIAMIFQEPMTALNPLHPIGRQIAEPIRLHRNSSRPAALAAAVELLARVGIEDADRRLGDYPHQFSGGQRQRIMIAMALSCGPDLLIADEPTTALDVTTQIQILDLLGELVAERGMAMILISHDLGVVARATRRLLVMYGGMACETGTSARLFAGVRHPYSRGLFAAAPGLARRHLARLPTIAGAMPELHELPAGCPFAGRCPDGDAHCAVSVPAMAAHGPDHALACWRAAPPA